MLNDGNKIEISEDNNDEVQNEILYMNTPIINTRRRRPVNNLSDDLTGLRLDFSNDDDLDTSVVQSPNEVINTSSDSLSLEENPVLLQRSNSENSDAMISP